MDNEKAALNKAATAAMLAYYAFKGEPAIPIWEWADQQLWREVARAALASVAAPQAENRGSSMSNERLNGEAMEAACRAFDGHAPYGPQQVTRQRLEAGIIAYLFDADRRAVTRSMTPETLRDLAEEFAAIYGRGGAGITPPWERWGRRFAEALAAVPQNKER